MSAIDWAQVQAEAVAAAKAQLGAAWAPAQNGATAQIATLVSAAAYIVANQQAMTPDEYTLLIGQQKIALQNILTGYQMIAYAAAQNTVLAVMDVVIKVAPQLAAQA